SGREIYRGKAGERQKTYSERISGIPAGWPLPQPKTPTSWEAGFATLSPLPKTQHYNQTPNTKPKPDTSYAMKTGLFNLLTTSHLLCVLFAEQFLEPQKRVVMRKVCGLPHDSGEPQRQWRPYV